MISKKNDTHLHELIKQYKLSDEDKSLLDLVIANIVYISKLRPNMKDKLLSPMELLCLILLSIGKNPDQCADLMGISVKTVRTYEQRARKKLGAKNRTNAFYLAQINGYISIEE